MTTGLYTSIRSRERSRWKNRDLKKIKIATLFAIQRLNVTNHDVCFGCVQKKRWIRYELETVWINSEKNKRFDTQVLCYCVMHERKIVLLFIFVDAFFLLGVDDCIHSWYIKKGIRSFLAGRKRVWRSATYDFNTLFWFRHRLLSLLSKRQPNLYC